MIASKSYFHKNVWLIMGAILLSSPISRWAFIGLSTPSPTPAFVS